MLFTSYKIMISWKKYQYKINIILPLQKPHPFTISIWYGANRCIIDKIPNSWKCENPMLIWYLFNKCGWLGYDQLFLTFFFTLVYQPNSLSKYLANFQLQIYVRSFYYYCYYKRLAAQGWERVIYTISVRRSSPIIPTIGRKKRKVKRVKDYSRDRAA